MEKGNNQLDEEQKEEATKKRDYFEWQKSVAFCVLITMNQQLHMRFERWLGNASLQRITK